MIMRVHLGFWKTTSSSSAVAVAVTAVLAITATAWSLQSDPGAGAQASPAAEDAQDMPRDPIEELLDELNRLLDEVHLLRMELAHERLVRSEAERDLGDLQRFMEDHDRLGDAYDEYRGVKKIAEREAHQRELEQRRAAYEREKAKRRESYLKARAVRQAERAEQQRQAGYDRAGFAHLGLDVYFGRASFFYGTKTSSGRRFIYEPDELDDIDNLFYRNEEINFSSMTISGSVLNASDETRNVGIAVVFFDQFGSQVGHEIVQINNARPDVPYPFTSTVKMALNRPFASSSQYVLYADPIIADTDELQPSDNGN